MQAAAVSNQSSAALAGSTAPSSTQQAATSAFGLSFDALLRIILTQLTYQDPLKPMDNFQFVSQLAQFSQIQLGQTTNDRLQTLVSAQSTLQAASLLGREVDISGGSAIVTGRVSAVSFDNGDPRVTVETGDHQTIGNVALSSISQIRPGD